MSYVVRENSAFKMKVSVRRKLVVDLRLSGLTFSEIAQAVKQQIPDTADSYDERYAWRDLNKALENNRVELGESAQQLREMMLLQLDTVMTVVYTRALEGDYKAVDRMIKLQEQKARLLGLYAPAQVKISDWRTEVLKLIDQNKLDADQVRSYLGEQLYREFIEQGSPHLLEAGDVEEGQFEEMEERMA